MAPVLAKSLSRLSRESILDLCMKWTQSENSIPYLASNRNLLESDEEDYLHEPAKDVTGLKNLYTELRQVGSDKDNLSKRDIIDRIVDGDWRRGLSLQQLADIDFANLEQNDTALRWSALKLVPLRLEAMNPTSSRPTKKRKITPSPALPLHYPTMSPTMFIASLKSHINPLVKAHYTIHHLPEPSKLTIIRLYIVPNVPFAPLSSNIPRNVRQATDSSKIMYIALPNSCPYLYISLSGSTGSTWAAKSKDNNQASQARVDVATTKRIILESIPKAFSKPQERWSLENTRLTCRSLRAMGTLRGNGRPGTAGGCFSKFSGESQFLEQKIERSQSQTVEQNVSPSKAGNNAAQVESAPLYARPRPQINTRTSDLCAQVETRFGMSTTSSSHAKLDRFYVTLSDILTTPTTSRSDTKPASASTSTSVSQPKRKRKRRSLEEIETGRDSHEEEQSVADSVQPNHNPAPITINFSGTDVFRGLKELALVNGGKYLDLSRVPAWMTGEKGVSGLTV